MASMQEQQHQAQNDSDPQETSEWLGALAGVIENEGADRAHFLIEKSVEHASTVSRIHPLRDEESIEELARMLGGVEITDTVLENAREMKRLAEKYE